MKWTPTPKRTSCGNTPLRDQSVTEANYKEFFRRHVMRYHVKGLDPVLNLEDCKLAVGLGSNASNLTVPAFDKKLVAELNKLADEKLRRGGSGRR